MVKSQPETNVHRVQEKDMQPNLKSVLRTVSVLWLVTIMLLASRAAGAQTAPKPNLGRPEPTCPDSTPVRIFTQMRLTSDYRCVADGSRGNLHTTKDDNWLSVSLASPFKTIGFVTPKEGLKIRNVASTKRIPITKEEPPAPRVDTLRLTYVDTLRLPGETKYDTVRINRVDTVTVYEKVTEGGRSCWKVWWQCPLLTAAALGATGWGIGEAIDHNRHRPPRQPDVYQTTCVFVPANQCPATGSRRP